MLHKVIILGSVTVLIALIAVGGINSNPSVSAAAKDPEIERIIFIDRFIPIDVDPTTTDPGLCDNTSSKFKTISGGVHWQEFPVGYFIDTTNFDDPDVLVSAQQAKAAVVRAFDTWDAEDHGGTATNVFFEEVDEANADITVEWNTLDGEGGTLGVASTTINPKAKKIVSAEIVLDSGDRWRNFDLLCGSQGINNLVREFDIEDVAAHEIGHAIGFAHVNGGDDVFNTEYVSIIFEGETHKRTLGLGDRDGIFSLYGDGGGDDNGGNGGRGKCPPGNTEHPKC